MPKAESKLELPGYSREEWLLPENIRKKIQKGIDSGERVVVRAPGRIDLAGGWNDTPPYHFDNEAAVLNTSVSFGNQWMIEVEIQKADYFGFIENDYLQQPPIDHIVMLKVLEFLKLSMPPVLITISNSIPKGSGLGGSSLLTATILSALMAYSLGAQFVYDNPGMIINGVLMIEQMLGSGGGWQDQIGGMIPGIKLVQTLPESCSTYRIKYQNDLVADRLSAHSLVLNTGIRRRAANVLEPIRELYIQKDKAALTMLAEIRQIARESFKHLEEVNIQTFAASITNAWNKVVEVETKSTIPLIGDIAKICGRDLVGYKIAGAGGGGFVILVFVSEDARNYHENKLQDNISQGIVYRPIFGRNGMTITQGNHCIRMPRREQI